METAATTRRRERSTSGASSARELGTWQRLLLELADEGILARLNDLVVEEVQRAGAERLDDPSVLFEPEVVALGRASVESVVDLFVHLVRAGDPLDPTELPATVTTLARDLARRGVPIQVLIRGITAGGAAMWRWGVARGSERIDDPTELAGALVGLTAAMYRFTDAIAWSVGDVYTAERERWTRSAEARRAETLIEVLEGASLDRDEAERRLAYPLDRHHVAFVIWAGAAPTTEELDCEASRLANALGDGRSLITHPGERTVWGWVALREEPTAELLEGLDPPQAAVGAAMGSPGSGIEGFRRSHTEALEARRIAGLTEAKLPALARYPDLALAALTTRDLGRAKEFIQAELGELGEPREPNRRLALTLLAYLEEGSSPRRTARRLGIHENTAANRVRAATELLGRPLNRRVPETIVALRLAGLLS